MCLFRPQQSETSCFDSPQIIYIQADLVVCGPIVVMGVLCISKVYILQKSSSDDDDSNSNNGCTKCCYTATTLSYECVVNAVALICL